MLILISNEIKLLKNNKLLSLVEIPSLIKLFAIFGFIVAKFIAPLVFMAIVLANQIQNDYITYLFSIYSILNIFTSYFKFQMVFKYKIYNQAIIKYLLLTNYPYFIIILYNSFQSFMSLIIALIIAFFLVYLKKNKSDRNINSCIHVKMFIIIILLCSKNIIGLLIYLSLYKLICFTLGTVDYKREMIRSFATNYWDLLFLCLLNQQNLFDYINKFVIFKLSWNIAIESAITFLIISLFIKNCFAIATLFAEDLKILFHKYAFNEVIKFDKKIHIYILASFLPLYILILLKIGVNFSLITFNVVFFVISTFLLDYFIIKYSIFINLKNKVFYVSTDQTIPTFFSAAIYFNALANLYMIGIVIHTNIELILYVFYTIIILLIIVIFVLRKEFDEQDII